MTSQLTINIIFGFIVGAGTNALAIYCIFRWIIPRKKAEMAASIREVVSSELFSAGKIVERLNEPAITGQITHNIGKWLDGFMERELTSADDLLQNHIADIDKLTRSVRLILTSEIISHLARPEFRENVLKPQLQQRWEKISSKSLLELFPQLREELPLVIPPVVSRVLESSSFRARVSMILSEMLMDFLSTKKRLEELLPPEMRRTFLNLAGDQSRFVIEHLADAMEKPEFQKMISETVCSAVHDQLSAQSGLMSRIKQFGAHFLGIDGDIRGMCARLPDTLRTQFFKPESQEQVRRSLLSAAEEFLRKDWRQAFNNPTQRQFQELIYRALGNALSNQETVNRISSAFPAIVEKLLRRPIAEISGLGNEGKTFDQIIDAVQKMLTGPEMRRIISVRAGELLASVRQIPLGRPARFISLETRSTLARMGADEVRALIAGRLDEFTEQTGLWNIVSDSVLSYDNKELERMIRRIASRELSWVTWLGGIIGALLGVIQFLFNMLLR
ncbi:MAG: DUF445 family protein [Victivallaceae bacterium]|nr:DUF445 family protein [Victivallaceae bacterium]MDD4318384.1 DUF445 family protein [Victivallaceae bacterium]